MRNLLVMRHAKSDWGEAGLADHDRPLAARGVQAARRMGRFVNAVGASPQLVVSSSALRARATAELASEAGGWGCPIVIDSALYASDVETVLGAVAAAAGDASIVLIAGHEPTWSELVSRLIGGGRVRMPTAAVACLDLARGGWSELHAGSCSLRWLVTPKTLE